MLVVYFSILIFSRTPQLRNASFSISCTFLGISRLSKPQSAKAPEPFFWITASLSNVAVFIFVHPLKALRLIFVTDLGMLNDSRLSALAKAFSSMVSKSQLPSNLKVFNFLFVVNTLGLIVFNLEPAGMVTVSNSLHPLNTSLSSVIVAGSVTVFSFSQPLKAACSSVVVEEGFSNVTVSIFDMLRNAALPTFSTVLGIVMDVKLLAAWKDCAAISLTVSGIA